MPWSNEKRREVQAARRAKYIESKGGCCAKCGSKDRLEVDHIDRAAKTMPACHMWRLDHAREDVQAEMKRCQVLCHDCHLEKTMAENQVPPESREKFEREVYRYGG